MEIIYILPALVPFVLDTSLGYAYYKNILLTKNVRYIIAFASGSIIPLLFLKCYRILKLKADGLKAIFCL